MSASIYFVVFLVCSAAVLSSAIDSADTTLENLLDSIETGATLLTHPTLELLVSLFSILCPTLTSLTGFSFTELEGENEPDVNTLTLVYSTPYGNYTYNITTVAEDIIANPYFNSSDELIVYIHGFTSSANTSNYRELSADFLALGNKNVLALDASVLLKWLYIRAASYVTFIGNKLGEVLAAMYDNGVDPANMYLIGHSLGAHIAGFAGQNFTNRTGENVSRITGLDPAGPCFAYLKSQYKLSPTDADFVDVIHGNRGVLGITEDVGQVNYYPNGGSYQTGCTSESCSHGRAVLYYIESIVNQTAFPAVQCDNYLAFILGNCDESDISYMGYASTNASSVRYFLKTASDSPYGLGTSGTSFT